jgi:hypothetical protein
MNDIVNRMKLNFIYKTGYNDSNQGDLHRDKNEPYSKGVWTRLFL